MSVPQTVQNWLELRQKHLQNPDSTPRVLPIVKIGPAWYFVDERLRELRNVADAMEAWRFETQGDLLSFVLQHGAFC